MSLQLNKAQEQAVSHGNGPALIVACCGTGKTRVLTGKVKRRVNQEDIPPKNIVAITFTRKASEEMLSRIGHKWKASGMFIGTFHSFFYGILRKFFSQYPSLRNNFLNSKGMISILSGREQMIMVNQSLKECGYYASSEDENANEILMKISKAKNDLKLGDILNSKDSMLGAIAHSYEDKKRLRNSMDFDDLLLYSYKLLDSQNTDFQSLLFDSKYIHVDEAQDLSLVQYQILKLMGRLNDDNLFLAGDLDQAIYGWRGSSPEILLHFKDDYPDANIIMLDQNYRSVQSILTVANSLIVHNVKREKKLLWSELPEGESVICVKLPNAMSEADFVAKKILLVDDKDIEGKEVAIFYRCNWQSRVFQDSMIKNNIPYTIYGDIDFYERKEVKDVVAYLKLAIDQHDDEALLRIIDVPNRYLGKSFISHMKASRTSGDSYIDTLKHNNEFRKSLSHRQLGGVESILKAIGILAKKVANLNSRRELPAFILAIRELLGYDEYLLSSQYDTTGKDRVKNLDELEDIASRYDNVGGLISHIDSSRNKGRFDGGGVQLMTMHKAKGLEFKHVFVTGLAEDISPHYKSKDENIEEERRLCYVAVTRAKEQLVCTYAEQYHNRDVIPSRFIEEMKL